MASVTYNTKTTTWYTDAVTWATSAGIVNGTGAGKFSPDASITREEMATMMMRYAKYKGYDTAATADLADYADSYQINEWAYRAMEWAYDHRTYGLHPGSPGYGHPRGGRHYSGAVHPEIRAQYVLSVPFFKGLRPGISSSRSLKRQFYKGASRQKITILIRVCPRREVGTPGLQKIGWDCV